MSDKTEPNDLIAELTDKAIATDIRKYERMIERRENDRSAIQEEIVEYQGKRDTLLDEVARRAQARKSKPTTGEVIS